MYLPQLVVTADFFVFHIHQLLLKADYLFLACIGSHSQLFILHKLCQLRLEARDLDKERILGAATMLDDAILFFNLPLQLCDVHW
jgi:hypothetical protein